MLYEVKLSAKEETLLAGLTSAPLNAILSDGWSAELLASGRLLGILPEDAATPYHDHPHGDADRIQVEELPESRIGASGHCIKDLGRVKAINVLSILFSFSPAKPVRAITLPGGAEIPSGVGYGWVYYRPSVDQAAVRKVAEAMAVIDLDIGCEIVTETHRSLVLYTKGYFVNVSSTGPPEAEEWVRLDAFTRRVVRRGA